ncbi:MAG TPA: RDD family protein [Acidimicrobiales bacterium]
MTSPAAGWYPDPGGGPAQRWWDGNTWTEHLAYPWAPPDPTLIPRVVDPGWPPSGPASRRNGLASYGARLGGWLLDWVIVAVVTTPFIFLVGNTSQNFSNDYVNNGAPFTVSGREWGFGGWWLVLVHAGIVLTYCTLMCGSRRGQTIGMMAAGTRVTTINGDRIGYVAAFVRTLVEYALFIVLFIPWVIDMLFPLWDPRGQTLHDKVVGSMVIQRPPGEIGPRAA